jgi:hypothetical protein
VHSGENRDFYLSPTTGKIKTLVIMTTDDIITNEGNGTWKRTYIRNIVPSAYRVALWPYNHMDMRESGVQSDGDVVKLVGKWIVASLALTVLVG